MYCCFEDSSAGNNKTGQKVRGAVFFLSLTVPVGPPLFAPCFRVRSQPRSLTLPAGAQSLRSPLSTLPLRANRQPFCAPLTAGRNREASTASQQASSRLSPIQASFAASAPLHSHSHPLTLVHSRTVATLITTWGAHPRNQSGTTARNHACRRRACFSSAIRRACMRVKCDAIASSASQH